MQWSYMTTYQSHHDQNYNNQWHDCWCGIIRWHLVHGFVFICWTLFNWWFCPLFICSNWFFKLWFLFLSTSVWFWSVFIFINKCFIKNDIVCFRFGTTCCHQYNTTFIWQISFGFIFKRGSCYHFRWYSCCLCCFHCCCWVVTLCRCTQRQDQGKGDHCPLYHWDELLPPLQLTTEAGYSSYQLHPHCIALSCVQLRHIDLYMWRKSRYQQKSYLVSQPLTFSTNSHLSRYIELYFTLGAGRWVGEKLYIEYLRCNNFGLGNYSVGMGLFLQRKVQLCFCSFNFQV